MLRVQSWLAVTIVLRVVSSQDDGGSTASVNSTNVVDDPFSLWPTIDPGALGQALNISSDCLDALNATLPCDNTLLRMAGSVDNYWWELDNLTQLCNGECFNAVLAWDADVFGRCQDDSLVAYSKIVPASDVTGRYNEGLNIACLTNQNATNTEDEFLFCLLESQEWVGSDFIQPDCSVNPSDPSCGNSSFVDPDNSRMANLYDDDTLCSECFVQMLYQRVSSPYLPDHDFSDYLIEQYQDIIDVCNGTDDYPELIIRIPPGYATAVPPALNFTAVATDPSCSNGQYIVSSSIDPNANCASLAQYFNVATGAVQAATNSVTCKPTTSGFCLPAACQLSQVPSSGNLTCAAVASLLSTSNLTVTVTSLLSWNTNINGLCDSLTPNDYICAGPPGGTYVPPPPPAGSSSDSGQQRGGADGSSTGRFGNATVQCTSAQQPDPVQDGILSSCATWCQAYPNDYCYQFAQETNITTSQLYQWNPVLGTSGVNCSLEFQAGYWYCVNDGTATQASSTAESTTQTTETASTTAGSTTPTSKMGVGTTSTQTSAGPAAPSPTQSGIAANCNKYQIAKPGDYCYQFAQDNGITTDQLYAWNTILGANGANCSTNFQAGVYYCIGVSS